MSEEEKELPFWMNLIMIVVYSAVMIGFIAIANL
jgi:hypothetical protein